MLWVTKAERELEMDNKCFQSSIYSFSPEMLLGYGQLWLLRNHLTPKQMPEREGNGNLSLLIAKISFQFKDSGDWYCSREIVVDGKLTLEIRCRKTRLES